MFYAVLVQLLVTRLIPVQYGHHSARGETGIDVGHTKKVCGDKIIGRINYVDEPLVSRGRSECKQSTPLFTDPFRNS